MKIQGLNYSRDRENNHQNPMLCMGLCPLLCTGWAYLTDLSDYAADSIKCYYVCRNFTRK